LNQQCYILAYKGKLSKIEEEINVVKNRKIGLNIQEIKIHSVIGFEFKRNIVELLWVK
jgi:hypothetical protein